MTNLTDQLKLCLITHITTQSFSKYLEFIEQAIHGGITMLQLREKSTDYYEVKKRALALQQILRPHNTPLIINDFVDLAVEIDADGVHVGNSDMSVLQAREKLGPDKIIGLSIESLEDLDRANKLPTSYTQSFLRIRVEEQASSSGAYTLVNEQRRSRSSTPPELERQRVYVTASAIFPSSTKSNCKTFWGIEFFAVCRFLRRNSQYIVVTYVFW